jgi:hypothetical protein
MGTTWTYRNTNLDNLNQGLKVSKHDENSLHTSLRLSRILEGYKHSIVKLGLISPGARPVTPEPRSAMAPQKGLNWHFDNTPPPKKIRHNQQN